MADQSTWQDPTVLAAIITSIGLVVVAILGWISGGWKALWKWWTEERARKLRLHGECPTRTLVVTQVLDESKRSFWVRKNHGREPAASVRGWLRLTNVSDFHVEGIQMKILPKGLARDLEIRQLQFLNPSPDYRYLVKRSSEEWMLDFYLVPPPPAGTDIVADLVILDQFGNEHFVKKHVFENSDPA